MQSFINKLDLTSNYNDLINNSNTGIEYELALFNKLQIEPVKTQFWDQVITKHKNFKAIQKISSKLFISSLEKRISEAGYKNYEIRIATQDDSVGPADLVVIEKGMPPLGLSVKYQNNCSINISSRYFLSENSIKELKKRLSLTCKEYIDEMNSSYGVIKNWFRRRKHSNATDNYNDQIRDFVMSDWTEKSNIEKKYILDKFFHVDSPINFWIVKVLKNKSALILDINSNPIKSFNPEKVILTKESTALIGFNYEGRIFGKMQVKFNNGILEKAKGKTYDTEYQGVKIKFGDPFGSWNFYI